MGCTLSDAVRPPRNKWNVDGVSQLYPSHGSSVINYYYPYSTESLLARKWIPIIHVLSISIWPRILYTKVKSTRSLEPLVLSESGRLLYYFASKIEVLYLFCCIRHRSVNNLSLFVLWPSAFGFLVVGIMAEDGVSCLMSTNLIKPTTPSLAKSGLFLWFIKRKGSREFTPSSLFLALVHATTTKLFPHV